MLTGKQDIQFYNVPMAIIKEGGMIDFEKFYIFWLGFLAGFLAMIVCSCLFFPRVHFETKISTSCTIPATEWKCQINADTNEITCKGVMK